MNSSSSVKTQSFLISVCRVVCVIRDETTTNHQNEPQSKCLLSAHQNKSVLSFVPEFISRTVIHIPQLQGGWSLSCDHGLDYVRTIITTTDCRDFSFFIYLKYQ